MCVSTYFIRFGKFSIINYWNIFFLPLSFLGILWYTCWYACVPQIPHALFIFLHSFIFLFLRPNNISFLTFTFVDPFLCLPISTPIINFKFQLLVLFTFRISVGFLFCNFYVFLILFIILFSFSYLSIVSFSSLSMFKIIYLIFLIYNFKFRTSSGIISVKLFFPLHRLPCFIGSSHALCFLLRTGDLNSIITLGI